MYLLLLFFALELRAQEPEVFFKIYGKTEKCFSIDEPVGTLVHAHYKISSMNAGKYGKDDVINLQYVLHFPQDSGKKDEQAAIDPDGVVMFTTKELGEYTICFSVQNAVRYDVEYKFALNLEVGIEAIDYENVAKTEDLNDVEVQFTQQIDLVKALQSEIKYQTEQHESFEQTTQSTIFRVKLFAIIQISIFAALAYWQYKNLKSFFRHIKVV
ncbi:transmembrane emp24 domain containing protein 9 precursor, putative [Entamoeba invadens IP1]|uniref:Transmembrane emp24 domain containing protein 9, putative n=1 Tax=Entamoeba invadens IP1 TaxID=370355 RepID=A0A0A1U6N7_ENTIV|nr:transmembrane emp24 domain containing protein 9 precursor, putative [Entamoeba invadens IP1]ELP90062.1 transmembrane emp24 domain containing protein 9 precursor, putative [Entamoeba invadens IP1]|eukprot:XP_004256833.1 transmembrane emp24 domain containing protein 9 precursor, putative [Entamoeba invadens IP1]